MNKFRNGILKFWREVAIAVIAGIILTVGGLVVNWMWSTANKRWDRIEAKIDAGYNHIAKDSFEHAEFARLNTRQDSINYKVDTTLIEYGGILDNYGKEIVALNIWQLKH